MKYWSDLFTPETFEAFARSDRTISGFRETQRSMAEKVGVGDKFICYMVRMSRRIGVLDVLDGPFTDNTPIVVPDDDPSLFGSRSDVPRGFHLIIQFPSTSPRCTPTSHLPVM